MAIKKCSSSLALFGLLLLSTRRECEAGIPALTLSPESGTFTLNGVDYTHGVTKWTHGAFVYRTASQTVPTFYVLNRQGEIISSFTPNIPGAVRVWVHDVDRAPDGSIVFSGSSYSTEGQSVPFLCWISADGQSSHVVRTAPYWPYALTVAPDRSIWTSGLEMVNGDMNAPGVNPNGDVIRHFNSSGNLIGSIGSRRNFKPDILESGFLVATQDRVGWYAQGYDGASHYIEISLPAMTLQTYPGLPAPSAGKHPGIVERFALTDAGQAFLNFDDRDSHHRTTYLFDRETARWAPVQVPAIGEAAEPHLKGVDGELLVFTGGNSARFFNAMWVDR